MGLPRAVFVTPILPAETGNGLAMRMGLFLEGLCRVADVDVVFVPVAGSASTQIPSCFLQRLGVRLHVIGATVLETEFSLLTRISDTRIRLEAFQAYGKPSLASVLSGPILARIQKIVQSCAPKLVHIGRSYLSAVADTLQPSVIATLDLDEDDCTSYASQAIIARQSGDVMGADWLVQEGLACDSLVTYFGPRFERIFVASEREAALLARRHAGLRFQPIQNAVNIPPRVTRRDNGATLIFIGSMGYPPNAEGVVWFVSRVLPRLRAKCGTAVRLLVAGAKSPPWMAVLGRYAGVSVLGPVPDVSSLYQRATLALAPMHAGGGTRIKLLEAAAHRVASVSTPLAAQGICWPKEAGGWSGSSAGEFAAACREGISNAAERDRRAMLALDWVQRYHNRSRVVGLISGSLRSALEGA